MKNQLSQNGSMKVPVQYTYGGKLKTIAHEYNPVADTGEGGFLGFHGTPLPSRSLHAELGNKATYQSSSSHFQLIIVYKLQLRVKV